MVWTSSEELRIFDVLHHLRFVNLCCTCCIQQQPFGRQEIAKVKGYLWRVWERRVVAGLI
jgi:hypothetical protein